MIPTPDLELEMRTEKEDRIEDIDQRLQGGQEQALNESIMFLQDKAEITRVQIGETMHEDFKVELSQCPNREGLESALKGVVYTEEAVRSLTRACIEDCDKETQDKCVAEIMEKNVNELVA